jgi:hypothetical protein
MLDPPLVDLALPQGFTIASLSKKGDWNMYDGVIWSDTETAQHFAGLATKNLTGITKPLFWVHLSDNVAQKPGTDTFTNEANLVAATSAMGMRDVHKETSHWGKYPVLSLTGKRPDGMPFYMAWIGLNNANGWAIDVDYRVPQGVPHPTPQESLIWAQFLMDTKSHG